MNKLILNADLEAGQISRHLYGHLAEHLGRCIYDGLWVGEDSPIPNTRGFRNDVVAALKRLNMPNLRWPGGCFADTYHWMDGIGPRERRPRTINVHWGGCVENNHCGTHEFLDLCAQLGCMPYICGNVGSGTVREMADWLEYLTADGDSAMAELRRRNGRQEPWPITFWGVGNENWGCGGNMRPQYYADLYRQYASYCRHHSGGRLYKIACGYEDDWNDLLLREAGRFMDGLSVHYYTVPGDWQHKGSATDFAEADWFITLHKAVGIDAFIRRTKAIMDRHDPAGRIGLIMDEWGNWFDVEPGTNPGFLYQQNTLRDAVTAAVTFNIFHQHADRLKMANIAQTVNVLQAMILTEGSRMLLTPTYHVFGMFKVHQDATLLATRVQCAPYADPAQRTSGKDKPLTLDQISASASRDSRGTVHLSLCNLHHDAPAELVCDLRGIDVSRVSGRVLTGPRINGMNTFEQPEAVVPQAFDDVRLGRGTLTVKLPARSVIVLALQA